MAKKLVGKDVGGYSFSASGKTITFSGLTGLTYKQILLVTNVTKNKTLYIFNSSTLGGSFTYPTLTIISDLTGMSDGDELQIIIWWGVDAVDINGVTLVDGKLPVDASVSLSELSMKNYETDLTGTKVERELYTSMSGTDDDVYTITSGKTLLIDRLIGGSENTGNQNASNIIELYYDPLGTGIGMTLIYPMFLNANNDFKDIRKSYVGNGTRKIRMRRKRVGVGNNYIYAKWIGWET